jgi:RNA polymerase sigma factor (sigma-70 family)
VAPRPAVNPSDGASPALDVGEAYRRHGHSVLRRARELLGSQAEALEALQEIFLRLVERPALFAGHSSLLTWLYAATTQHCLNRLRNHKTRTRLLVQTWNEASLAARNPAESRIELRQLLERLDGELATAAVYHYLDRMTQDEIAEVMGCSRRHVGHLLERLRKSVRQPEASP